MRSAITILLGASGWLAAQAGPAERIEQLNRSFLEHVQALGPEHAIAARLIAESWHTYRATMPESFVPDALAVLYPAYREALAAFDRESYAAAARLWEPLRRHADPYVAANAHYFHARALIEQGLLEEAEAELQPVTVADGKLGRFTPYVAHLWFLRAYGAASNLRFEQAAETLQALAQTFPDAAEAVHVGARQLLLEIERRERGTLEEVATVMGYSAARLRVADTSQRVRGSQDVVIALLDKLIQDTEQQENEQRQRSSGRRAAGTPQNRPRAGAEQSALPDAGAGQIGEQHAAPRADPGEMWGRLPPAEREKILQSLRDRFPSRYRQLVEQYYRSLAEGK